MVAVLAAGCGSGHATQARGGLDKTDIRVGTVPTASSGGLYVALQRGFFRQAGLHVTPVNVVSGNDATVALKAGAIDVLNGAYVGFIQAQAHHVAQFHVLADGYAGAPHVDEVVAARRPGIRSPEQLRGKTIAVNALNSVAQLLVESALSPYGIKPSQVRFVAIPFPGMIAALQQHRVDAAFEPEPYLSEAEAKTGDPAVLDVDQGATQNFPISGYVTTAQWFERHPKTAAAFAHALQRGQAAAASDRAALQAALARYTQISPHILAITHFGQFPTTVDVNRLQRVADVMHQFGMLNQAFSVAAMTQGGR